MAPHRDTGHHHNDAGAQQPHVGGRPSLVVALAPPGSYVEIQALRGRNIFYRNRYEDIGPVQLYGDVVETVIAELRVARIEAFVSYGQWRGWIPPPRAHDDAARSTPGLRAATPTSSPLSRRVAAAAASWGRDRGTFGNGVQPNVHNAFVDNVVEEGNNVVKYDSSPRRSDTTATASSPSP